MPNVKDCPGFETFGADVKQAREAVKMSRRELAEKVGVTRQTIGLIEAGGYNPTLNLCIAICKALDKTLDQLFWEDS